MESISTDASQVIDIVYLVYKSVWRYLSEMIDMVNCFGLDIIYLSFHRIPISDSVCSLDVKISKLPGEELGVSWADFPLF